MVARTTRPAVPLEHGDAEEHRRLIADRANASLPKDGSQAATHPILLHNFNVVDLPDASLWEAGVVYVDDEAGGETLAFSDGTNWRRVQDRVIVS